MTSRQENQEDSQKFTRQMLERKNSTVTQVSNNSYVERAEELTNIPGRTHFLAVAILLSALAVYGSLVPFQFTYISLGEALERFRNLPFQDIAIESRTDWGTNFLLFLPITFSWMGALLVDRHGVLRSLVACTLVALGGVLFSTAIEFSQTWFPPRVISQKDIFAESTGGIAGVLLWLVLGNQLTSGVRSFRIRRSPLQKLDWLSCAYTVGLLIFALLPLDLTVRPSELFEKYRNGKIVLVPAEYYQGISLNVVYSVVREIFIFIPVGVAVATFNRPTNSRRSLGQCLTLGFLLTCVIELSQICVLSRVTDATDILTGTAGICVGAWMIGRQGARQQARTESTLEMDCVEWRWLAFAAAYTIVLAGVFWSPFNITYDTTLIQSRLTGFYRVPFSVLQAGTYTNAMFQVLRKVLWFLPFGAAIGLSIRGLRRRQLWLAVGAVAILAVAVGIELGKVLIPSRVADLTNVLLEVLGASLGMLVASRLSNVTELSIPVRKPSSNQSPSPRTSTEIPALNGLRAIACLAVFGVHFHQITNVSGKLWVFDLGHILENGHNGVAVFFTLSGFLLSLPFWRGFGSGRELQLKTYGLKRVLRILPAYYICLTALVLAKRHWHGTNEILDTVLHYLFLHNYTESTFYGISSPFWTIGVQAQFYFLLPLVFLLGSKVAKRQDIAFLLIGALIAAVFAAHWCLMSFAQKHPVWPLNSAFIRPDGYVLSRSVLAHLPLPLLGVLTGGVHYYFEKSGRRQRAATARWCELLFWLSTFAMLSILCTPLDRVFQVPYGRYHFPYIPLLVCTIVLTAPIAPWARSVLEFSPLRMLGVISYGVYVFHLPCLNLLAKVMNRVNVSSSDHWFVLGMLAFLLTIAVSWTSYLLIERRFLRISTDRPSGQAPE